MRPSSLATLAGFSLLSLASQVSAQPVPCTGEILGRAPNQLRTVLQAFCIEPSAEAPLNLDEDVQYAGYNDTDEFVLAYNGVTGGGAVEQPIHVVRLDKRQRAWTSADFSEIKTEILPGLTASCLGAIEGVQKAGALFYVSIHLSPSAGCLAVISRDLKLQKVFSGWIAAEFSSGAVVLEGSTVHFAPTHPLSLSLFDPSDGSMKRIYPVENDPLRTRYVQRLRTEISPADRCQGENCEADPEHFDSDLTPVCPSAECKPAIAVNDEAGSLAFGVQFSPIGFIRFEKVKDALEWDERVVFVYRFINGEVEHREFTVSEMQSQFGVGSIDALLMPDMLKRVFGH